LSIGVESAENNIARTFGSLYIFFDSSWIQKFRPTFYLQGKITMTASEIEILNSVLQNLVGKTRIDSTDYRLLQERFGYTGTQGAVATARKWISAKVAELTPPPPGLSVIVAPTPIPDTPPKKVTPKKKDPIPQPPPPPKVITPTPYIQSSEYFRNKFQRELRQKRLDDSIKELKLQQAEVNRKLEELNIKRQ
jgi:hypothetical protein